MENIIRNAPHWIIAIVIISISLLFFMIQDPPKTICDAYKEVFLKQQEGVLTPKVINKKRVSAKLFNFKNQCQQGNSAGSCYEYFQSLHLILTQLVSAPSKCQRDLYETDIIRQTLFDAVEIMTRIAWGASPPEPSSYRISWMQESERFLFCKIKNFFELSSAENDWIKLRKNIFTRLPGYAGQHQATKATDTMTEEEIWRRSLFSISCRLN